MLALGLMSGTSADGASIALADFKEKKFRLLKFKNFDYPDSLRRRLIRLGTSAGKTDTSVSEISAVNRILGDFFAVKTSSFLKSASISRSKIAVIGSHGHTIYHGPGDKSPNTLQIGEPSIIAEKTGIPVVSDFRQRDIAAGGEGAPLIPFFDQMFFRSGIPTACQNIGGIANVTLTGRQIKRPIAFDTGPGNCLIDEAVTLSFGSRMRFDPGGKFSAKGKIHFDLVHRFMRHSYFSKKPPKSTGRELFQWSFVKRHLNTPVSKYDLIATLTYFTALSIAESYRRFLPVKPKRIVVSGGGAKNKTLMHYLQNLLSPASVQSIEELGIPAQAKEPVAFAYFALRAIQKKSNHLPSATGAQSARILGKITY